jgi:hypothetical protein
MATKKPGKVAFDTSFSFGGNVGKRKNFTTGVKTRSRRSLTKSQRYFSNSRGGSGE